MRKLVNELRNGDNADPIRHLDERRQTKCASQFALQYVDVCNGRERRKQTDRKTHDGAQEREQRCNKRLKPIEQRRRIDTRQPNRQGIREPAHRRPSTNEAAAATQHEALARPFRRDESLLVKTFEQLRESSNVELLRAKARA